ncbi:MAG: hypothetical protein AAGF24_13295 [Cyanobacteria bacterium P01_H01_bin.121]
MNWLRFSLTHASTVIASAMIASTLNVSVGQAQTPTAPTIAPTPTSPQPLTQPTPAAPPPVDPEAIANSPSTSGPTQLIVQPNFLRIEAVGNALWATPDPANTTQQRTLTVRSLQPLQNLRVRTADLYNDTETQVFSQRLIRVDAIAIEPQIGIQTSSTELSASYATVTVTLLTREAKSGAYSGELTLVHQDGEVAVPLTVMVKDPALPWPLIFLTFGVILSTSVSGYSSGGRANDEITVTIQRLRSWIEGDRAMPSPFANQIESHLVDAEQKRGLQQFEEAQADLEQANTLWFKWRRERQAWIDALQLGKELEDRTKEYVKQDVKYINNLRQALLQTVRQADEFSTPESLQEQFAALNEQFQIFDETYDTLRVIEQLYQEQINQNETLKLFLQGIDSQLNSILPSDPSVTEELRTIQAKLDKLLQRQTSVTPVITAQPNQPTTLSRTQRSSQPASPASNSSTDTDISLSPTDPDAGLETQSQATQGESEQVLAVINWLSQGVWWPNARRRLRIFYVVSYTTSIVILAGLGFSQLYLQNATFGAKPFEDYLGLLAWGFGSEAARSKVTQVVRKNA